MVEIAFSTTVHDRVVVEGELDGNVIVESHENRPNWRVEDDGTVTLLPTIDIEIEEFGELLIP